MSKSTPSLLALLGLVAYAGYQNRDRIGDMLTDATRAGRDGQPGSGNSGYLADIGQRFQSGLAGGEFGPDATGAAGQSAGLGGSIAGALGDLIGRFRDAGRGHVADSWVGSGPNHPVNIDELGAVLGPDTLDELSQKTGLSQHELLLRLNAALPEIVDHLTPNGKLPPDDTAQARI